MKHFKYLLLMLMAVLSFASCEKEDEEENGLSQYIKITSFECERVGSVLRIDYTMKNVSGQNLRNIKFGLPTVVDNNGERNYQNNKLSFNGGDFQPWATTFSLSKGEKIEGTFVITEFDETNKAKRVDLTFDAEIGDVDFNGEGSYSGLSIKDNRLMAKGIQTNDLGLTYEDVTCTYQGGNAYLSFYVTSKDADIRDYTLRNYSMEQPVFRDNKGNTYTANIYVSFGDGGSYPDIATTSLRAGVPQKVTYRIPGFSSSATQITTGVFPVTSTTFPMTDDHARVYDIPVR